MLLYKIFGINTSLVLSYRKLLKLFIPIDKLKNRINHLIATVVILIVLVAKVFVGNLLKMGGYRFFILNQTAQPGIGTLLDGFRSGHYVNIVLTMFLRDLFTALWSLLLVVPGIVKHYEYLMVPYIIAENPAMDYKEAFQISKQMMDGEKMEAFIMDLSFLGWYLLSAVTCGLLAIFYVNPYVQASFAEMYTFNKQKAYHDGYIR